jgi:hypothetical protein
MTQPCSRWYREANVIPSALDIAAPATAATPSPRRRVPVERINRQADEHGIATAHVDLTGPIDRDRLFTSPTLAPLAHSPAFAALSEPQRRRYNQLVGLMQNEIICFFEQEFAVRVLPALLRDSAGGRRAVPAELARSLRQFVEDERQHTQLFRRLNQLAEPTWYAGTDYHILRLPAAFRATLRWMTNHPSAFPMVFWVMLLMEERSLMISRRYAAMDPDMIEPHFAAAYRAHLEDEVRHVQLDWHLLDQFYHSRPARVRRINARLLEAFVVGLFLKPRRANVRLIDLLIEEFPDLRPRRTALLAAVRALDDNAGYRDMMYSPEATPIAHLLFDKLPEFHRLRRRLYRTPEVTA